MARRKKEQSVAESRRTNVSPWLPLVSLAIVITLVYAGGLEHPFVFDDLGSIVHNPQIRSLKPSVALFPPPETPVGGRPIVNLSFALNYAAGGLNPFGYHLTNVALHVFNACLVFGLFRRFIRHDAATLIASATALVWAIHPINSEAVNYVTQRTELMMAACYLLTLYAATRALEPVRQALWTAVAIAACAVGMMCKESMVSAPIAVMVIDRIYHFDSWRAAFDRRRALYAGLVSSWVVLAMVMLAVPRTSAAGFATTHVSTWTYLLNQSEIITRYFRLALWPDALVHYYGWATLTTLAGMWPYVLIVTTALAGAMTLFVRAPKLGCLALWVFFTLAPTSSVVPIASEVGAERRMYLPMIGLVGLMVVAVARRAQGQERAVYVAIVVVAAALGYRTVTRTAEYVTPLSLAETVAERWPTPSAEYMLGTELAAVGRQAEAISHLRVATESVPPARFNLGSALLSTGQRAEGISQLERFVREEPGLATARDARLLLARAYSEEGRHVEAIDSARQLLAAAPDDSAAHGLLAEALVATARFADAIPHYQSYLRSQQSDAAAWTGLGIAQMSSGRHSEAINSFRQAVRVDPNHPGYRMNLARALIDTGQPSAAIEHAETAVRLTQGDPAALELLELARKR